MDCNQNIWLLNVALSTSVAGEQTRKMIKSLENYYQEYFQKTQEKTQETKKIIIYKKVSRYSVILLIFYQIMLYKICNCFD